MQSFSHLVNLTLDVFKWEKMYIPISTSYYWWKCLPNLLIVVYERRCLLQIAIICMCAFEDLTFFEVKILLFLF